MLANVETKESVLIPRLFIAGVHGSSGKTTVSIGIAAALKSRGYGVQTFKKGPDFIDPLWLTAATGRPCRNLDFFIHKEGILPTFSAFSSKADISLIEGNQGLFDGVDPAGTDSGSAMARLLSSPVILVVDARKMTRGIAPLLQGYLGFEDDLNIAGVILNNVAGPRHEGKLIAAVERYTSLTVLGSMPRNAALSIGERHLGLETAGEKDPNGELIEALADRVREHIDLDKVIAIANQAPRMNREVFEKKSPEVRPSSRCRIAVAKDQAFSFYYPENLEALEREGAELIFFSPCMDAGVPDTDGLYLGGGFPEVFAKKLSSNESMLTSIRFFADSGKPVYAECGGLMYLSRAIFQDEVGQEMSGVLPFEVEMTTSPQGRGYMILETDTVSPDSESDWEIPENAEIFAHEFHYSRIRGELPADIEFGYRVKRGSGINGRFDGIIRKNVFASYVHIYAGAVTWWAPSFLGAIALAKRERQKVL